MRGIARQLVLLLGLPAVAASPSVSAETRAVTGTSVILHGYQAGGTVPDWVFAMAEAIRVRAGEGRVFEYQPLTGDLVDCASPWCGLQGAGGETVIVFDWADDSNDSGEGFSEGAAEALFAGLVAWSRLDPPLVDLEHLHLIGHSRGAVIASEVAERLLAAGLPAPEHVTNLDPHDSGALKAGEEDPEKQLSWEDLDVNQEHPDYQCSEVPGEPSGVCAWAEVGLVDNFWRDIDSLACFLDPDGKPVPGAAEFDGSGLDDFCHSDVHTWYFFTIDTAAATDPVTGDPPADDWFVASNLTCETSARTWPLARAVDGFNFSRVGGGAVRCPDDPGGRQEVLFDFNLGEGLVNGDFERDGSSGADMSGWSFHGGGGPAQVFAGGNSFLDLYSGEWREHNRLYLPRHATGLSFCRRVFDGGNGEVFSVVLKLDDGERTLFQEALTAVSDWECLVVALEPAERDRVAQVEFRLTDSGGSANVGVDDVRLVAALFADGFESGGVGAWSGGSGFLQARP